MLPSPKERLSPGSLLPAWPSSSHAGAPSAPLSGMPGPYPAVKLEESVVEHLVLFSQEAVPAFLLQLSLPLALRDKRLHLRAQSHHILLCHGGKREEGISVNPSKRAHTRQGKG